ncbi:MAG: tetratricopeptide repeat protein, partial [Opitutales bacterium]
MTKVAIGESPVWTPTLTKESLFAKAHGGDAYYQAILGIFMRAGEMGMKMDFETSRKWSQKAASGGEPLGLYNLATVALLAGEFKKSHTYYEDAQLRLARIASQGDPIAQYAMGEICYNSLPIDHVRAIDYFRKSAEGGYPQGQATLGALFLKGIPSLLPKDTRKGIALLGMAARHHSWTARQNLGMAYYNGDGVAKDNGLAIRWLRLAADQNSAEAQHALADLLSEVDPVTNKHEIIRLLRLAANQNHASAKEDLRKYTISPKTTGSNA